MKNEDYSYDKSVVHYMAGIPNHRERLKRMLRTAEARVSAMESSLRDTIERRDEILKRVQNFDAMVTSAGVEKRLAELQGE